MATQTSQWHLLPDLCLRRACTYSHDVLTLHELRLVCRNFYNALPIPEELLQRNTIGELPSDPVHYVYPDGHVHFALYGVIKDNISIASLTWFVRLVGIVQEDVTMLNYASSVDVLRFFCNLYGESPKFIKSSGIRTCPLSSCSLETMQFLLEEQKIDPYNKLNWFGQACLGGNIACMEYTKNKFAFTRDDIDFPVVYSTFLSSSIGAVDWLVRTFHLSSQYLTDQNAFRSACETGNLEFIREVHDKYNVALTSFDYDFSDLPYTSLGYAIGSNNLAVLQFVEELYGGIEVEGRHHHLLLQAIYNESKGTDAEQKIMLDYVCDKYNIDPRSGTNRILACVYSSSDCRVMEKIQSKFKLTADEVKELGLLRLARNELQLRVLKDVFHLTAEDARANNCEVLRRACEEQNVSLVHGLHTVFGLSRVDAERCHAVEATATYPARLCLGEVLRILREEYGVSVN